MYGDPAVLSSASISNPKQMIKMHDIFSKHGSTTKLPDHDLQIFYTTDNGYATFQSLIFIASMKVSTFHDFHHFDEKVL